MACMCTRYIRQAMEASQALMNLADGGEGETEDSGCFVLSGVIRDCAHKIRSQAELEMQARKAQGMWAASEQGDDHSAVPTVVAPRSDKQGRR